ncbi:hypothetical protein OVY01_12335 [Robbsia sp. Bb-Pol-6]|uniref:Uncharacterized protein n=1 Tax=Robbsia betulipollinis TaxID=2981849 RepID=A0ABT3ZNA9_9BURK|nr:hypothetical protein [Robbsia betulipollinis]MCY0388009.1 hypothetical protein [Robbsia betulipollinis]
MSRLVRLLSASTALHTFGRARLTRVFRSCRDKGDKGDKGEFPAAAATPAESQRFGSGIAGGGIKRTASVRPVQVTPLSATRSAVRVYRGSSGTTMVGKIDAICRMIDRCIADESAAMMTTGNEAGRSI